MKKLKFLAALSVTALCLGASAQTNLVTITSTNASGGTTTITLPVSQIEQQLGLPTGVSIPAFNANGLDFTNTDLKVATGLEYLSGGGTASYLEFDYDFYHGASVDFGVALNGTLSAIDSGFQAGAIDFELIKNFSNFQLVGQLGIGGVLEGTKSVYGEESIEINYNLTAGTGASFLGGTINNAKVFTYVFVKVTLEENGATSGNINTAKELVTGIGVAF